MSTVRYGGVDPEPLGPEADDVLAALSDDLAYHGNLASALADLLQRGLDDMPGLAELLTRLRERRDQLLARYDPNATLSRVREELDAIVSKERASREAAHERTQAPEHLLAQMELDALPYDIAERLTALEHYDFFDEAAHERFDDLLASLRSSLLAQSFEQLASAIEAGDADAYAAMLSDLASLIERFARGEDISDDLEAFQERYPGIIAPGESFEDFLARLEASRMDLERLLASVDDDTRRALERLQDALAGSPAIAEAMRRLGEALGTIAGFDADAMGFRGSEPLGLGELGPVMRELGRLDTLEAALRQATTPDRLGAIEPDEVRDLLGADAQAALERLSRTTEALEAAGLMNRTGGRVELSPRAVWRLGDLLLRDLARQGVLGPLGQHAVRRTGVGTEPNGEVREWRFGDPFRLALADTLRGSLARNGPGIPLRLDPDDFMIEQVDDQARQGTVLALDLSLSMPLNDTFLPAKRVALALASLVRARFPADDFSVVVFSETAREVPITALPEAQWDYVYGTNIQHALALARQRLRRVRGRRQVLLVTDGEPTAHADDEGSVHFAYPPTPETLRRTLAEVVRATRERIEISVFVLARDRGLRRFVEQVVAINHGKAYYPGDGELGTVLLDEFLTNRLGAAHTARRTDS